MLTTVESAIAWPSISASAPLTVVEPLYAPARVVWADDRGATIEARGVRSLILWSLLESAMMQGGDLGAIYMRLHDDARRRLQDGRFAAIAARGLTVSYRGVGQCFGVVGVIRRGTQTIAEGTVHGFGSAGAAMAQVVNGYCDAHGISVERWREPATDVD